MDDKDIMIKINHVSKQYQLGTLDGRSFREEAFHAGNNGLKKIKALDDVSFEVKRGETVGIIGANGAGKSTLLKLLSRITAPTDGTICLDGTISSMLEVGTGFHQELSGRENIYINGTILGMKRREIDSKLDAIIEFSECGDFIDTPVKRYSSGMYVKLAFAVAAFLESDIMILDEVLAVGDMKFQNKCLEKIRELSLTEGRTVLCVSHNMATISKLCKRCIVLEHGKLIFDGDTQNAVQTYFGEKPEEHAVYADYSLSRRFLWLQRDDVRLQSAEYLDKAEAVFWENEKIQLHFTWKNKVNVAKLCLRVEVRDNAEMPIATAFMYDFYSGDAGEFGEVSAEVDISSLREGQYRTIYTLFVKDAMNESTDLDCIEGLSFEKRIVSEQKIVWASKAWGCVELPEMKLLRDNK